MIEDKLERNERLRLECLAQAIATGMRPTSPPGAIADDIIERAAKFEEYVRSGKQS